MRDCHRSSGICNKVADFSDNPSADSVSLKLSMPGVASFVFLSTDYFFCLALSKDLKYLKVTRDSLLTFAQKLRVPRQCLPYWDYYY